jgi:CO/xanthine dehydrogenase FAD-binding subunit
MKYYAPATLNQAEKIKKQSKKNLYFAGGTVLNWRGEPKANALIDLKNLGLDEIKINKTKIVIGAMVTIQDVVDNKQLPAAIVKAAKCFTSSNVRNMATVGGSATGNYFVSDLLPVFLSYNADVEYFSNGRKKIIPLLNWLGKKTGIICSIIIKDTNRLVKVEQEKISAIDFPIIVSSIGFKIIRGKIAAPVVSVSGARAKTEVSASAAAYLSGKTIGDVDFEELNSELKKDIKPSNNVKATPRVKKRFIENHIKTMISEYKKELK